MILTFITAVRFWLQCYHFEKRHQAPIWALLSFCSTEHILETRQKSWVSLLVLHVFCIETFMSNNPLPRIHTHTQIQKGAENKYEHSVEMKLVYVAHVFMQVQGCLLLCLWCSVETLEYWQVAEEMEEPGGRLYTNDKKNNMTHPCKYSSQD